MSTGRDEQVFNVEGNRKKGGCWKWGCGGCLSLVIILIVAAAAIASIIKGQFKEDPFPSVTLDETEQTRVEEKVGLLEKEAEGETVEREVIRLTEREINGFLAKEEATAGKVRISLKPDVAVIEVLKEHEGKLVNLSAEIFLRHDKDAVEFGIEKLKFGSIPVPRVLTSRLNLREAYTWALSNPDLQTEDLEAFERTLRLIRIEEGSLRIDVMDTPENKDRSDEK